MKLPDFRLARINSAAFMYHKNSQLMTAELSELVARARTSVGSITRRVYNDACDQGFEVVSQRTGRTVLFVLDTVDYDQEGDVQAWQFVPAEYIPGLQHLVVFND